MITNLIATITVVLVTNITERVPTYTDILPCPHLAEGYDCLVIHYGQTHPVPDATNKWIRTQIKEQTKLDYTNGLPSVVIADKILSDYEAEFKREVTVTWTPVATNEVKSEWIWNNQRVPLVVSNYYSTNITVPFSNLLTNNVYIK